MRQEDQAFLEAFDALAKRDGISISGLRGSVRLYSISFDESGYDGHRRVEIAFDFCPLTQAEVRIQYDTESTADEMPTEITGALKQLPR
jgi:hypothetical protein